ncbi:exodeoxyribonuclease VII large subunit [Chlorobium sp. N1]|uniref:exodeoxyribonuclease VII large subunit n=1 Tax=Chlorobium sp. N1 TaxID=2491138 RepID=UPI00103DA6D8|nr:exodeoxyribonuclease VII large subunit [Chlorobium sp. N1]TCD47917.1 exodeoxyribonuclease VII large subunit [Chlorobium sp. N1]
MTQTALSVSELTRLIKGELESTFPAVRVRGEISNCKKPSSGHLYLTLKDEGAQVPAVVWKHTAARLQTDLRDGMSVVAEGRLEVYMPAGRYQLICSSITEEGQGALQLAFAELLRKLSGLGWFREEIKKRPPRFPRSIGLITSPTGAVIEDMQNVLSRRYPAAALRLYPVKVQGRDAAPSVVKALRWFNAQEGEARPDVLIVARGGGSMEDLQAFNEESVALAIYRSGIPVISAVGHETDITIADMVADLRAGTPSIAAELAVPDSLELLRSLREHTSRQSALAMSKVQGAEREIESIRGSYAFNRPLNLIEQFSREADSFPERMRLTLNATLRDTLHHHEAALRHLSLLDYRKTLERGYVLVKKEGKVVTGGAALGEGDRVELSFRDGTLEAEIRGDLCSPG